jgi:hypothetical protein
MASNTFTQHYADGTSQVLQRRKMQGRPPSGLAKPQVIRLSKEAKDKLNQLSRAFGQYWNENDFIRNAVSKELCNSVYTELLKS